MSRFSTDINFPHSGSITAATGTVHLDDQFLDSPVPLSETGESGISPRLTRSSVVGAINEVESRVHAASGLAGTGKAGYEFTGGFVDRLSGIAGGNDFGTLVAYTRQMANNDQWMRFGLSESGNITNDVAYWSDPDPSSNPLFDQTKGLFGGLYTPQVVSRLIDFSFSDEVYTSEVTGESLNYTAASGTFNFSECLPGDLAVIRFDFNIVPQVPNTTVEVGLIWFTRDSNGNQTAKFALTTTPIYYGVGSVGRTFLNRPLITAYFASNEDVRAVALPAIKANNPVQIAPLTTLVTIQR
jgi:hypothetical protein